MKKDGFTQAFSVNYIFFNKREIFTLNKSMIAKRTKVCFFSLDMRIGGVERQLYYLLNILSAKGIDVHLILCQAEGEFLEKIHSNVKIYSLEVSFCKNRYLWIILKLCNVLQSIRPDIMVSFHSKLHFISFFSRLLGVKKFFCCYPGYFRKGRLNFFRRQYLKFSTKLVAVSEGVKKSLIENLGVSSYRIEIIENVIDSNEIHNKKDQEIPVLFENGFPVIVSIGRIDPQKGFDVFIESYEFLKHECNYLIVGDGSLLEELKKKIYIKNASGQIVFTGSQKNPYPYLNIADIFVLASESEGLPTSILEAMVLKKPVITTNYSGGTKGVVEHNITGIVIPCNNPLKLSQEIDTLIVNKQKMKRFSEAGYIHVINNFNIEKYARKYISLFDS